MKKGVKKALVGVAAGAAVFSLSLSGMGAVRAEDASTSATATSTVTPVGETCIAYPNGWETKLIQGNYEKPALVNGEGSFPELTEKGLAHTTYFTAVGTDGQVAQGANSTAGTLRRSIVDIDRIAVDQTSNTASGINAVFVNRNTSSAAVNFFNAWTLPGRNYGSKAPEAKLKVSDSVSAAMPAMEKAIEAKGIAVTFQSVSSATSYETWADFTAANPVGDLGVVVFRGTLAASDSVEMTLPLVLTNASELSLQVVSGYTLKERPSFPSRLTGTTSNIRFAQQITYEGRPLLESKDIQYLGTVRNTDRSYTVVPDYVQEVMPNIEVGDLKMDNQVPYYTYDHPTRSTAGTLYTAGTYYIVLNRIQEAVSKVGYSVNIDCTSGNAWSTYAYTAGLGGAILHEGSGSTEAAGHPMYVELHKIIEAHDIEIDSCAAPSQDAVWQALDSVVDGQGNPVSRESGDIKMDTNADLTKPGTYEATFSYTIGNEKISRTVKVKVTSSCATPEPSAEPTSQPSSTTQPSPTSSAEVPSAADTSSKTAAPVKKAKSKKLAFTGGAVAGLAVFAVVCVIAGGAALVVRRRKG